MVGETIDLRRAGRLLGQLGMAKLGETQVTDCRGRPAALYQYAVTAEQTAAAAQIGGQPLPGTQTHHLAAHGVDDAPPAHPSAQGH